MNRYEKIGLLEERFLLALEVLEGNEDPFMESIQHEKSKTKPSKTLIKYWNGQIKLLADLARNLKSTDSYAIELLLSQPVLRDDLKSIFYPLTTNPSKT
jgi:hypothetical protein